MLTRAIDAWLSWGNLTGHGSLLLSCRAGSVSALPGFPYSQANCTTLAFSASP